MKTADIVQLPQIICEECHKREATILCDYDIGYNIDLEGMSVFRYDNEV